MKIRKVMKKSKVSELVAEIFQGDIRTSPFRPGEISDVRTATDVTFPKPLADTGMSYDWNVTDLRKKIAEFSSQGKLSTELLRVICIDGLCAPIECELLDYKEDIDTSTYGKGKLVLRIVSFYNSYGGYLIFGVQETEPESKFDVIGIDPEKLDVEALKASVKAYTGERIQITALSFTEYDSKKQPKTVLVLHIPQRGHGIPPLHFIKDGPGNDQKKPLFIKDSVYCRVADECIEARGPKILALNSERRIPYLSDGEVPLPPQFRINRLPHNLPDRNFICARFVGRDAILNSLWRWLGDDLSHMKVLAGEGGLGKSSIAYEFVERVSENPGAPFEQVVWLTAKEKQFRAFEDEYVNVPERHFTNYEQLLLAICDKLPYTSTELEGATLSELKRMVKAGLAETPSLIVVDDVDSLSPDEQKQVLELGGFIAASDSRLIFTTRFNQSVSNDNVIKLDGLNAADEFPQYIQSLRERISFPELSAANIAKIHEVSGGSPLFAESVVRLLRWHSPNDAITQWQGERGTAVRDAALRREVESLSMEAKRILLTVAKLGEASVVELSELLGYHGELVERSLVELEALFLVAAPALASIRRFRVPDNTRRLVIDRASDLITDKARLEREITEFRKRSDRSPTRDARVAAAISQAAALVRINDIKTAMSTIKDARRRTQNHFDLISYQATLHLKENPRHPDDARRLAREAYVAGCRKDEVFSCWFEAEWEVGHYIGALEAAEAALECRASGAMDWMVRKSAALASRAGDYAKSNAFGTAVKVMFEASSTLRDIISKSREDGVVEWEEQQSRQHDQIWIWANLDATGLVKARGQLDTLEKFWKLGDFRINNLRRVLSVMDGVYASLNKSVGKLTSSQRDLVAVIARKVEEIYDRRCKAFPADSRHIIIREKLDSITSKVDLVQGS